MMTTLSFIVGDMDDTWHSHWQCRQCRVAADNSSRYDELRLRSCQSVSGFDVEIVRAAVQWFAFFYHFQIRLADAIYIVISIFLANCVSLVVVDAQYFVLI